MKRRQWAVMGGAALLLVVGYLQSLRAGLFGSNEALVQAVARVDSVPEKFDEWTSETRESDPATFKLAGADGYWTRVYRGPKLRTPILVILMCGRSGKMSVHTPEVCYAGAGYEMINAGTRMPIASEFGDTSYGEFWSARFGKPRGGDLRLVWAWATSDGWLAPENPRWEFTGQPYLYKLYVSQDSMNGETETTEIQEFLRAFLPEVKSKLFPASGD